MKKHIYILGMISISIVLIATITKSLHLPGAAILLVLGLGTTTFVYLPYAYAKLLKSNNDPLLKWVFHAGFIAFAIDFIGMLFKIMHWPGAGWFLLIGIPLPFVLFLPAYIIYHSKRKLKTDMQFLSILLFMIYLGVFSSLLSLSTGQNIYDSYARTSNSLLKTNSYLQQTSTAPETTEALIKQLDELKTNLLSSVNPEYSMITTNSPKFNFEMIQEKRNRLSHQQLLDAGLESFNRNFEVYKNNLPAAKNNSITQRLLNEIDLYRLPGIEHETPLISRLSLIVTLNVITDWQNKLLLIAYLSEKSNIES